jgi:hypothetical protein
MGRATPLLDMRVPHTSVGSLSPNELAARSEREHNQNGFWLGLGIQGAGSTRTK